MRILSPLRCIALTLLLVSTAAAAESLDTLAKMENDAFDRLNQRRAQVGLAPMQRNKVLDRSAAAHAAYITQNLTLETEGHDESPRRRGYTGTTPTQRMTAAGYSGDSTAENIAMTSYPLGALSTDDLIDAPYHRQAQFGNYLEAGVAMSTQVAPPNSVNPEQYIYVINFGAHSAALPPARKTQPFVYPVDGQQDVPADWIANESPNPLPDRAGERVGYPISLSADPGDTLVIRSFSLSDANGIEVDGRLITTHIDNDKPMADYAFWIPLQPMQYDMRYQASAAGTLNGKAFTSKWQFTTLAASPLQLTPSAPHVSDEAGSVMTVRLSGGTGSNFTINYGGHRYQYFGKTNPKATFVTPAYPAPDLLVLTRNNTPCAKLLQACEIIIKGKDATEEEISLVLPVK